jgi:ABC-type Fe3+/spermidine/putrescine transport system ATPase subunit
MKRGVVSVPTTTGIPAVALRNLGKTYPGGTVPAVADLSLEIQEGEVFTLLGPSGCGKSTTLRMVAGLETPDTGSIRFGDRLVVDVAKSYFVPTYRRNIGMVFQSYAIWPHMTVAENVAYPLRLRRVPKQEIRERVERVLRLVGLTGLEKRPAPLLSGGQQQRVALARALIYEPSLLLLDEPFSNLDTNLREQMRLELKILQARLQVTILFVTHDQVEALSLSDRIAVMDAGRIRQLGTPRELYDSPKDSYVRDFLGKTVLVRGVVDSSSTSGGVAVAIDGAPGCVIHGTPISATALPPGTPSYVAVRPEHVDVGRAGSLPSGPDLLPGVVQAGLFVGDRTDYRVLLRDQNALLVRARGDDVFGVGEEVFIRLRPGHVSVWPRPGGPADSLLT